MTGVVGHLQKLEKSQAVMSPGILGRSMIPCKPLFQTSRIQKCERRDARVKCLVRVPCDRSLRKLTYKEAWGRGQNSHLCVTFSATLRAGPCHGEIFALQTVLLLQQVPRRRNQTEPDSFWKLKLLTAP